MLQSQLPFAPFRNEGLFTDHYLLDVLPQTAELWDTGGLGAVRQELSALWEAQAGKVEGYNEAQLEEEFIRPVLRILGHLWEVQPSVGTHQPDYAFFAEETDRDRAQQDHAGGKGYWSQAFAVGDAKAWERKLDKALTGGSGWGFHNPSFQIYHYLAETGCRWAILTNGRHWRIYSGDPKPNMQVFYEVDLPALLQAEATEQLAFFWLFFRRQAFTPDAQGKPFLDRVRAKSDLAAERLREDVKERVYRALLEACRGFVGHKPNGLAADALSAVYDNALVFLYRLLFVLYAEAAELLPLRDSPQYRDHYSLHAIKKQIAELGPETFQDGMTGQWRKLLDLFGTIDGGHAAMGVPAYNGGLFAPEKHRFLEENALSDRQVARVVDLLARTPEGRFVDYRDLGVRHLGSIYEGLLEYRLAQATAPMVVVRSDGKDMWAPAEQAKGDDGERCEAGELYLVTDKGERKATGSYYTPQFIVEYIVENTLGPLVDRCQSPEDILDIKVLDPAMGSGHFLVEATDFLAHRLLEKGASVGRYASGLYGVARYGDAGHEEEADLPALKRLVVERCIYGVDLNPLAVELAKLSLWLDTVAKGQPLSFLDHHLRCGNSLIGAWWRAAAGGEPPNPEGRRRRATTEGTGALFDVQALVHDRQGVVERLAQITAHASDSREAVKAKGAVLAALEEQIAEHLGPLYDLWVSAYFGNPMSAVEWGEARMLLRGEMPLDPEKARELVARAKEIADEWRFFHWELAFPEVFFDAEGRDRPDGGFSAVVGNPPWERTDFEEVPFFTLRRPEIALAPTGAKRKSMIADLEQSAPALWREYQAARANVEAQRLWFKASGHFPLTGSGRPNYYALFAELSCRLLSRQGLAGMIVPSGIATDMTTADLFADLVDTNTLQALLDFENKAGLFADVHREQKFSILILTGGAPRETIEAGFFLHTPEDLTDPERVFPLRPEDCVLMNPNTRTCPIFRTRRDAALTRAIYERVPVLVRETEEGKENPWGASFKQGLFNMTSDSGLFRTAEELDAERFYPVAGKRWRNGQEVCLPLYEGKMIWHFDHRYANALDSDELRKSAQASEAITFEQKSDPGFSASPRYWVSANEMAHAFAGTHPTWFLGFRDIANPNNARTFIVAGIPGTAVGHTLPLLLPSDDSPSYGLLLGNLCAFVLDYVVRRKVGSRHVSFFIVEQLPVLPPARYEEDFGGVRLADFVAERVLELTYTAHDMAGFAHDMGYVDETGKVKAPFPWDEEHRLHLRCQLDALYFHLYGLTREEAEYVLETFPIVKRHDLERFGKYRTKELIGHYYNAYAAGDMAAWVEG